MKTRAAVAVLASALVLALAAACGTSSTPPAESLPPPVDETMMTTQTAPPPEPPAAPPPAVAATPPPPPVEQALTDAQIAGIAIAAHLGEVEQGRVAQTKGADARIKRYAATMIQHHGDAAKATEKALAKSGLKTAESDLSMKLAGDSQALVESWKTVKGTDFDKAYIDAQVRQHGDVLSRCSTRSSCRRRRTRT
jgi:putative membrane protein